MSTYDGNDIFGSGNHRIVVGGLRAQKKRTAFAGIDGVDSMILGGRGRPVMITGQLRSATIAGLDVIIGLIEDELTLGQATLVDNFAVSYDYVELDTFTQTSVTMYTGSEYIINYRVTGTKLF